MYFLHMKLIIAPLEYVCAHVCVCILVKGEWIV